MTGRDLDVEREEALAFGAGLLVGLTLGLLLWGAIAAIVIVCVIL